MAQPLTYLPFFVCSKMTGTSVRSCTCSTPATACIATSVRGNEMNPEPFLGYLDKEMTIMGILSAFSVAAPAGILVTVLGKDSQVTSKLWNDMAPFLIVGSILCVLAALLFYKQRSVLAWNYGQICLIQAQRGTNSDFDAELAGWLRDVDGWDTWWPYCCAFTFLVAGFADYILAIIFESMSQHWNWVAANLHNLKSFSFWGCLFIAICSATLQSYVRIRFKYEDDAWKSFFLWCIGKSAQ
jgi:hypothetical protein